jgi:hypothetical protein
MPLDLELRARTLATFDAACRAIGEDPEAVRTGQEVPSLDVDQAEALLEVVTAGAAVPPTHSGQAAVIAGRMFFEDALQQVAAASEVAEEEAERCAVLEVLKAQSGDGKRLQRILSTMEPDAYQRLYHDWPIERALSYLMLRTVDHVSENLDDYI